MDNEKTLGGLVGETREGEIDKQQAMSSMAEEQVNQFFAGMNPGAVNQATEEEPVVAAPSGDKVATEIVAVTKEDFENAIPITAKDAEAEANARIEKHVREGQHEILDVLDNIDKEEDDRIARLENTGVEAYAKKANGAKVETTDVDYDSSVSQDALRRSSGDPDYNMLRDADFVPSFGEAGDEDEVETSDEAEADEGDDYSDAENTMELIGKAPMVEYTEPGASKDIITLVRKRHMKAELVSTGKFESKTLADQAFNNSVNKFKMKNFRSVRIPLINSGFFVDMVGTGANDLVMLYDNTDRRIGPAEYELNRLRTIIRSVVGAEPHVNPNELKNLIHHRDYPMMAYGQLCATLDEVVFPNTCPKCNRTFKVKANPADMILNVDDMSAKITSMRNAKSAVENSLMGEDIKLTFESGFEVTIGHPSYYDEVVMLNSLNHYLQSLKPIESAPMAAMTNALLYIKRITLPNGLRAANVYQTFKALRLMDLGEYDQVNEAIVKLRDQIIEPRIGVHDIVCPHCKEKIPEIEIDGVAELIFFLTTVIRAEKDVTKK